MIGSMSQDILPIGKTKHHYIKKTFGIRNNDRFSHLYIVGQTGTGKTTLLENFIFSDLKGGRGFVFLDPHGDSVEKIYASLSETGKENVIYLNAPDNQEELGYNPVRRLEVKKRPLASSGIIEIFKKLWGENWGPRTEHIFRNCIATLLDQPQANLGDLPLLITDKSYRIKALEHVENQPVKDFWQSEFDRYSYKFRAMAIAPIQNKVGAFLANPIVRQILTHPKENISLRRVMDEGKVLLVNLSKGKLGEDASHLLGGLLVTSLGLASYSRADTSEGGRKGFTIYGDEFQNYTPLSLINMASELRKYRVSLVLSHQYLHQLDKDILEAVLGNAGTLICFRVGASDAVVLERMFYPVFDKYDLLNLPNYEIILRLMIDGKPSEPFGAYTFQSQIQKRISFT